MALLLLLKERNIPLHALSVDHGLRAESASEAAQVAAWCKALDIAHTTLHWRHGDIGSGLPEKAREARYALMFEWCRTHGIRHLLTAHHRDDQVETFLLRLLRGSGIEGLSGILPVSERQGIFLHRPLLAFSKERLIATLKAQNQQWIEDPSNRDMRYSRNALRQSLDVLMDEDARQQISQLTIFFQKFRNLLESKLSESINLCLSTGETAPLLIHSLFMAQPPELKTRMLHHICKDVGKHYQPIRSEKILRLLGSIETGTGKHMLGGAVFYYRPRLSAWEITRAKPLAAKADIAQNNTLKQRTINAQ